MDNEFGWTNFKMNVNVAIWNTQQHLINTIGMVIRHQSDEWVSTLRSC